MTPVIRSLELETLVLKHGSHATPEDGMCILEAVAWVAGEEHSDRPKCASRVVSAFMRSWNAHAWLRTGTSASLPPRGLS